MRAHHALMEQLLWLLTFRNFEELREAVDKCPSNSERNIDN